MRTKTRRTTYWWMKKASCIQHQLQKPIPKVTLRYIWSPRKRHKRIHMGRRTGQEWGQNWWPAEVFQYLSGFHKTASWWQGICVKSPVLFSIDMLWLMLAQLIAKSRVLLCPSAQLGKARTIHPGISPKTRASLGTFFGEKNSNWSQRKRTSPLFLYLEGKNHPQ